MIGPPLPPSMKNSPAPEEELIGPPVPTGKKNQDEDSDEDGEDEDIEVDEVYCEVDEVYEPRRAERVLNVVNDVTRYQRQKQRQVYAMF